MRQNIQVDPSKKLFESYIDFSGGLNSEIANENLRDNEYPVLDNVDLSNRGSAKKRTGRKLVNNLSEYGIGQGLFHFFREGEPKPDTIIAVGGKIFIILHGQTTAVQLNMTDAGAPFTFQTTKQIEAVQYGTKMYVATGTKIVVIEYENPGGFTGKVIEPYKPTVMEAIYIGTNALAPNPDTFIQDGVDTTLKIAGIKPTKRTGIVNTTTPMTVFINKPVSMTSLDYKWEFKKSEDTSWTIGKDWTNGEAGKTYEFSPDSATTYDIKAWVRDSTNQAPTTTSYLMTMYPVNMVEDSLANNAKPHGGINKCRKIMQYWDRLILAGDDENPYQIYISDLNNPAYVPTTNTISFDTGKLEPITSILRFRDMLIVFTKTTVQTLYGRTPEDFVRSLIHDKYGCISERGAAVTGNTVTFVSEEGIHILKPNTFILEVLNVHRTDIQAKSEIAKVIKDDVCVMVQDSQFWVSFPSSNMIYRMYFDEDAIWVRDKSSKLNIVQFLSYGNDIQELTKDGKIYLQDNTIYTDDGVTYDMDVETKFLDLSASFNYKKLKKLYVLARHFNEDVNLLVYVQADSNLVLNPEKGEAYVDMEANEVKWRVTTSPNMHFYSGSAVGAWVLGTSPLGDIQLSVQKASILGKCRRVKLRFKHTEDAPCEIYGFGLEFKAKKV